MTNPEARTRQLLLLFVCAVPLFGAVHLSDGLFTIDELIYLISADALARDGALTVDNGFSQFGSEDLNLWFLVEGPNGLAPQYPPGVAILGLPFYLLFETRGLIVMNALAAVGVTLLTWATALKLYQSSTVAIMAAVVLTFGTFHLDYAWAIWPHMTSTFFVILAFYLALHALEAERARRVFGYAVTSGLAVGAAMLMRTDGILILPVIAACVVLAAARPVLTILGGALGLLPGIAVSALVNLHKFGTLNFLSYGRTGSGGGDDLTSYLGTFALLTAIASGILAIRLVQWTANRIRIALLGILAGVLSLAVLPATSDEVERLARGYFALFVDARTIHDNREGVSFTEDGVLRFWGVAKKALFQSMPWLAVLGLLAVKPWTSDRSRANGFLLLFVVIWSLPFATLAWHGGFSSSMRYFLPLVPALVILASVLIVDIASRTDRPKTIAAVGVVSGVVFAFFNYDRGIYITDGISQQVTALRLFALSLLLVPALWTVRYITRATYTFALMLVCFGIGYGGFGSVLVDNLVSQGVRSKSATVSAQLESIEGPALFYGQPELFAFAVSRRDVLIGVGGRLDKNVDVELFIATLRSGYRTIIPMSHTPLIADLPNVRYERFSPNLAFVELFESRSLTR